MKKLVISLLLVSNFLIKSNLVKTSEDHSNLSVTREMLKNSVKTVNKIECPVGTTLTLPTLDNMAMLTTTTQNMLSLNVSKLTLTVTKPGKLLLINTKTLKAVKIAVHDAHNITLQNDDFKDFELKEKKYLKSGESFSVEGTPQMIYSSTLQLKPLETTQTINGNKQPVAVPGHYTTVGEGTIYLLTPTGEKGLQINVTK